ncbi:MAG: PilZ domain-containing protein [Methylococcales bacterium]|nr:PilZ domain-containing protein [Methylococcales bacterium]
MSSETFNNKRRYHRIFYRAQATLSTDTLTRTCEIIDISLKGCLLRFEQPWQENIEKPCFLKLQLSPDISIVMQVVVSHTVGNDAGFKCEYIDIDSISQLRRLVELNLGNSELLERDILSFSDAQ